jgi:hypothetical protein
MVTACSGCHCLQPCRDAVPLLPAKPGLDTGERLAKLSRHYLRRPVVIGVWVIGELAATATNLARISRRHEWLQSAAAPSDGRGHGDHGYPHLCAALGPPRLLDQGLVRPPANPECGDCVAPAMRTAIAPDPSMVGVTRCPRTAPAPPALRRTGRHMTGPLVQQALRWQFRADGTHAPPALRYDRY